jgi:hypothetical protein
MDSPQEGRRPPRRRPNPGGNLTRPYVSHDRPAAASIAAVSLNAFASDLENSISARVKERQKRERNLALRESFLFWITIVTAALAPILVCVGISLMLGHINSGNILLTAAGTLSGGVSAGIFRLRSQTASELRLAEEDQEADLRFYRAVRLIQMIPDPARQQAALACLAGNIVRRSMPVTEQVWDTPALEQG